VASCVEAFVTPNMGNMMGGWFVDFIGNVFPRLPP
jgi:hypothetical protein